LPLDGHPSHDDAVHEGNCQRTEGKGGGAEAAGLGAGVGLTMPFLLAQHMQQAKHKLSSLSYAPTAGLKTRLA